MNTRAVASAISLVRMLREEGMKQATPYKNYLIHAESFQRQTNGTWVPQYTVTRQDAATEQRDYPSHQYQFNHSYLTEREAHEFALARARDWIDKTHL